MARQPIRFATYHGDTRSIVGRVKGPNNIGEPLVALTAEYDTAENATRVGFAYATMDDVASDMPMLFSLLGRPYLVRPDGGAEPLS